MDLKGKGVPLHWASKREGSLTEGFCFCVGYFKDSCVCGRTARSCVAGGDGQSGLVELRIPADAARIGCLDERGDGVAELVERSDSRSKGPRFESRQELKKCF